MTEGDVVTEGGAACAVCGAPLPAKSHFCPRCGAAITDDDRGDVTGTLAIDAIEHLADEATSGPGATTPVLLLRSGPQAGSWFALDKDVITVGRHPDSDVFLNDVTVSRRHAEIRREDDAHVLYDAGSLNGTYVNHERQERAQLRHGAEIQIGRFRFTFFVPETA